MRNTTVLIGTLLLAGCGSGSQKAIPSITEGNDAKAKSSNSTELTDFELTDGVNIQFGDSSKSEFDSSITLGAVTAKGVFRIPDLAYASGESPGQRHVVIEVTMDRDGKKVEITSQSELAKLNDNGEYVVDLKVGKPSKPGKYNVMVYGHTGKHRIIVARKTVEVTK